MNRLLILAVATVALVTTTAPPASARLGLYAGLSLDPDDFLAGLNLKTRAAPSLHIVPSVEAGCGDVTMIAGNLDLHYLFKTDSKLAPYAGGGVTLNWFDFDGDDDVEFGGSLLGGLHFTQKLYFETKVGLGDVPDWKFLVGFRR